MKWASLALLGASTTLGCGGTREAERAAPAKNAASGSCHYEATLADAERMLLDVRVRCKAADVQAFVASEEQAIGHVSNARTLDGKSIARDGPSFRLRGAEPAIEYRVDLAAVAEAADDFDVAERVGQSILAPASTWLLRPEPARPGLSLTLSVRVPPGARFATGLSRAGADLWEIEAHELHVGTYAAFGRFEQHRIALDGNSRATGDSRAPHVASELEVVTLDGNLDAPSSAFVDWVRDSARAVGRFWGGFPVERALVVLLPVPDRTGVLFGKVLPESAPGIVIVIGEHTDPARLPNDWILVHELFHLGFPSFQDEGKWLDEGLATYYEPLIRARAGWRTEQHVWDEFVHAMPQGLDAVQHDGLEHASSFRGVYWGGAIIALLADVEARKRSAGKRGLENGLRALLDSGGHASEVWPLERAIATIDSELGSPLLLPLAAKHAERGASVSLDAVWRELGIRRTRQGVTLDDSAPLAGIRRAVVYGAP